MIGIAVPGFIEEQTTQYNKVLEGTAFARVIPISAPDGNAMKTVSGDKHSLTFKKNSSAQKDTRNYWHEIPTVAIRKVFLAYS